MSSVSGRRPRRALLFINRGAGNGSGPAADAVARLRAGGLVLTEPEIAESSGLSDAIRTGAHDADLVIVGGGDGTINAAAAGLVATGLPLGILPLGTANDLARTLALPIDPVEAARVIVEGHVRRLDLGEVNGKLFFNVASIGFSARLARRLTSEAKARWGRIGYAAAALRLLAQSCPFPVDLEHDGTTETARSLQVSVGSGRHHGGGMTVSDAAAPDDVRLDVYSLEIRHWLQLVALLPALRRGTQRHSRHVRAFTATELVLRTRRVHEVNADGELLTTTPAHFRIRPAAVSVFVPS